MSETSIHLLLVEDNVGDIRLMQEALKESGLQNTLHVARDGEQAIAYLQRRPPYTDTRSPDIVVLDLNLPRISGYEVLSFVKGDSNLKSLPVIVMTSSDDDHDVLRSYRLHANSYITKPSTLEKYFGVMNTLVLYWSCAVKLPKNS